MKTMFPQGIEGCDLGCYPACPGFSKEGCLMFGGEKPFKYVTSLCIGQRVFIFELPKELSPTGVWEKNHTVTISKSFGAPRYMDEKIH